MLSSHVWVRHMSLVPGQTHKWAELGLRSRHESKPIPFLNPHEPQVADRARPVPEVTCIDKMEKPEQCSHREASQTRRAHRAELASLPHTHTAYCHSVTSLTPWVDFTASEWMWLHLPRGEWNREWWIIEYHALYESLVFAEEKKQFINHLKHCFKLEAN